MKKIIVGIFIFVAIFAIFSVKKIYATGNTKTSSLQFEVINNKDNKEIQLYILLSKDYIKTAISDENIEYNGPETLKQNNIPNIAVEKQYVQDEVYTEDGTEYVQILLKPDKKGIYKFEALSYYLSDTDRMNNIKYRIKDEDKDFIVHINNFITKNNICEIEYNYENQTIKQPDKKVISFATIFLIILLVIIIVIGFTSYIKQRSR